jgi:hypothetical protein
MLKRSPTLEPSLENLAYVLRHQELWPEGFVWDYRNSSTCALGLCKKLYNLCPEQVDFRLVQSPGASKSIFCDWGNEAKPVMLFGFIPLWERKLEMYEITPEIVADRIDNWLATQTI